MWFRRSGRSGPSPCRRRGPDGTQVGEVVQRLVDGLQRDVGHHAPHPLVHPLRRGVGHTPVQGTEDALPLRGDLAAVGPEEVGQGVG